MSGPAGSIAINISGTEDFPCPPSYPHPDDIVGPTGGIGEAEVANVMTGPTGPADTLFLSSAIGPTGPIDTDTFDCIPGVTKRSIKYKGILDVKKIMDERYSDKIFTLSSSLDVLALYMQSQAILYTESKVYCEQQLNMLMLPAIFISALCTFLSVALQYEWIGPYIISGFTGANSFILALISYLKLDAKAEAHKTSAYQYEKLRTICEFYSGKTMFFTNQQDDPLKTEAAILTKVEEIHKRVEEVRDTNKFILPQQVRYHFIELYRQNLFSDVKELQLEELKLLTKLKVLMNQVSHYDGLNSDNLRSFELPEYIHLVERKDDMIEKILDHRKKYSKVGSRIKDEIDLYVKKSKRWSHRCCAWLKT